MLPRGSKFFIFIADLFSERWPKKKEKKVLELPPLKICSFYFRYTKQIHADEDFLQICLCLMIKCIEISCIDGNFIHYSISFV